MPIKTVEPQRLYRQIAEQIRTAIAAGEFPKGARLPAERDLARQLGVSRPSLREALIALEVEGLIEVRTGSGIYVLNQHPHPARHDRAGLTEWGPMQLMQAREMIEGEVAALAARHARRGDIRAMAGALDQMKAAGEGGEALRLADEAFHNAIAAACGNEVLRDTVTAYQTARHEPIYRRLGGFFETPSSWQIAIREHDAILEAVRSRDAEAARAAMQGHLKKARARYNANWNQEHKRRP